MNSSTTECSRCGGIISPEGTCSVCGVTQELSGSGIARPTTDKLSEGTGDQRRPAKGAGRPAFLFNKLTNDRFALNQSVSKIGRDQTNNISINTDHYISRHHAWVLQMQGGYWVEDLGSTNGTLLNGEVLNERKQIFPGDRLTFGKTELVFVVE